MEYAMHNIELMLTRTDHRPARADSGFIPLRPLPTSLIELFTDQVGERFAPGRAICWQGEPATNVFRLLEGHLRIYRTMEDGRRAILRFGYPGDLLCLSASETYLFTAEAATPIRFQRLWRSRFDHLVEESATLSGQLHAEVCNEMKEAQEQIIRLGRTAAEARVASFFLATAQRAGPSITDPVEIQVPFGRLDIADYLGLTVETVSREISRLKHNGLISLQGPHQILLRRIQGLREIARMDIEDPRRANGKAAPDAALTTLTVFGCEASFARGGEAASRRLL
jgi:CRP/FNR family transcriptional regulator, anaerobic regulatory protein